MIINALENCGLDLQLCNSQGYDIDIHCQVYGYPSKDQGKNSKIMFVPCANQLHTNLCGVHAFAINSSCAKFFATLESVYSFFYTVSVKHLSDTRWSAKHEAVKSILKDFDK
ncbi:unnamed protein product [Diabrotica balteata]|uniref:Uncharacterized protein n=1 Tax=Diabrotica balteata TaxID=107213 RepID=A0A9N9SYJ6_DIABA|nr:unnamed protein product [Diabrotica balteata]